MSEEVVEQITIDQPKEKTEGNASKKRDKDPKKVAAGKKLAEYNKKAKEALARETQRMKSEEEKNENGESEAKAWLPELSFTTVLSIVGIGFTAFDMFMRYYKNRIPDLSQVPQLPQTPTPQPSNIITPQTLKIGMI